MITINTNLTEQQIERLKRVYEKHGVTRAELIRRAIDEYLKRHYGEAGE